LGRHSVPAGRLSPEQSRQRGHFAVLLFCSELVRREWSVEDGVRGPDVVSVLDMALTAGDRRGNSRTPAAPTNDCFTEQLGSFLSRPCTSPTPAATAAEAPAGVRPRPGAHAAAPTARVRPREAAPGRAPVGAAAPAGRGGAAPAGPAADPNNRPRWPRTPPPAGPGHRRRGRGTPRPQRADPCSPL